MSLASLIREDPSSAARFIVSQDFPRYMLVASQVRELIFGIYTTNNVELMHLAITHDKRKIEKSVVYLAVFRLSILSDNVAMSRVIYGNINFSPQVIADSLENDTGFLATKRLLDPGHNAYLAVLEILKSRSKAEKGFKRTFFEDYLGYRILTYISPEELLENLVALDNPEYLRYVAGLWKIPEVVLKYTGWALLTPDNPSRLTVLMEVAGRLPDTNRREIETMITRVRGQTKQQKMQVDEEKYDQFLERLRAKLVATRNIRSWSEVEKAAKDIRQMEDSSPVQNKAVYTASTVLLGRYRYLK